ncbi:TonB-dependent receptor [Thioalkalivibrio nitratireducens DSM 14787]|uniref:TonB-dependent receptor n=1 Tax=Thioalkalivibrio nitratireducens (strain DSM 14787 / UNIQEM 213 / ALEN2) TaxID=1255043 RepID=L0DYR9_THIND|nr:TonB-dependent receptor [Thioalkalivibrio nitratireducens]AGA34110.1 TonB-dependent receptor [Thioalkalivibrio nitratireducens DSM 14787]
MARKTILGRRSGVAQMPVRTGKLALAVAVAISGMAGTGTVKAEESDAASEERASVVLPRIDVVAPGLTDVSATPGAVTIVTEDEIKETRPRSTEDVLRRVPGMYIKREDDSAIVTNYGVRGIPADQYKTTVLEDGVPVQPGIFVGNQRYYNPRVQRMDGVEILRGAASLRYGPASSGGVINYQTRTPDDGLAVTGTVGSWNTREVTVEAGGSSPSGDALFGLVVTDASSDGWMDKEWDMTDVMIKVGSAIGDNQFLGAKFSYYENDAAISYRGYFQDAFDAGATFNPAPDDRFETERTAFDVNHEWDINPDMRLKTVAYWMETSRDYWRFNVDGTTTNADGHTVWNFTDILEGRNRDFERIGVDSRLFLNHSAFGINNTAEFGLRYMEEEMHDTRPRATRAAPRSPIAVDGQGLRRDRLDSAKSWAGFAENRFDVTDQLSVTAGLRVETYEQKRKDRQTGGPADTFSNTEFLPGLGATYQLNPALQFYGSVYRAFQPPVVGSVIGADDAPTDAETSVNLELGMRGATGPWNYEAAAFQMDFSNQVDPGISGIRNPNEGSALIQGLEAAMGYDLPAGFRLDGNVTWVPTAEFREDRVGGIAAGNRLPYSPEWVANVALSYEQGPLKTALMYNYTGSVFGTGDNRREIDPENHGFSGLVPSHYTVDLTASYDFNPRFAVFGAVKNLTDERYIAGLRQGIYAGPERSFEIGARYEF